ncbi:MAG: PilN domain-containing protein [Bacteroidetes bacterium]|nr:PilN domain-containing protein [Bacteroidota bacterium]
MLRLAVLGRTGPKLNIMDLASMPLPIKQFAGSVEEDGQKSDNPFDDSGGGSEAESDADSNIDLSSIREFVATHYIPRASFALGFEVPYVRTHLLPVDKKDTPSKIRNKVVEEVGKSLNVELAKHAVSFTKASEKHMLAIARVEESPIVEICTAPQGGDRRQPRINCITSNEVALINMVRVHFRAEPEDIVHVIHVDDDVTHFFVMRGHDIEYIGPAIQQGAHDAHLVSTLYNRIELTAEGAGYLNPDKVVLSGKAEEIGLKEEILENNPEVVFHSLKKLRVGHSDDKDILRDMNNYLIPISLAWQELQPRNQHFYRLDVLPAKIREEQKRFKLAWHGVILLLLLFVAVTALTVMSLRKQAEIQTLSSELSFDRRQIAEQKIIVDQITELEQRSTAIRNATTTLDTLLINAELWTETLDTLATAAAQLRDTWVSEMKVEKDGAIMITGYAMKRSSIPTFSNLIGKTRLREVTVQEIGEAKVFRYDIQLRPDSLYPYSNSRAARWHDSVRTALGVIAVPEEKQATPIPEGGQEGTPPQEIPPESVQ